MTVRFTPDRADDTTQNEFLMEDNHENKFLPFGARGSRFGQLYGGTNHCDYDNDDAAGDHHGPRARRRGDAGAAATAR
jgi:hypothetical protein